jgi:hypothetical protein
MELKQAEETFGRPLPPKRKKGTTVSDKLTPLVISAFISVFAVDLLYAYSDQKELWIAIVSVVLCIVVVTKGILKKKYYNKDEINDVDAQTLLNLFSLVQILIFIISKLVIDWVSFIAAIYVFQWYMIVNLIGVVICFVFAIFSKLEFSV